MHSVKIFDFLFTSFLAYKIGNGIEETLEAEYQAEEERRRLQEELDKLKQNYAKYKAQYEEVVNAPRQRILTLRSRKRHTRPPSSSRTHRNLPQSGYWSRTVSRSISLMK